MADGVKRRYVESGKAVDGIDLNLVEQLDGPFGGGPPAGLTPAVQRTFRLRGLDCVCCLGTCLTLESQDMFDAAGRDRLLSSVGSATGGRDWYWWRCRSSSSGTGR